MHTFSAHPTALVHSIPYAQHIRLRRNCTHLTNFQFQANLLQQRLLVHYSRITKLQLTSVNFITQYSGQQHQLRNILYSHWHILCDDPTLTKYICDRPDIVFRRASSLRDRLTKRLYNSTPQTQTSSKGLYRCGHCAFCPWVSTGSRFTPANGELFYPSFRGRLWHPWCSLPH